MRVKAILLVGVVLAMSAATAVADTYGNTNGYTNVGISSGSEPGQAAILHTIYGGTWSGTGAALGAVGNTVFTNGTLTATRVHDDISGVPGTNLIIANGDGAGVTDQTWQDGTTQFSAEVKYSALGQTLWIDQTAGTTLMFGGPITADGFQSGKTGVVTLPFGTTWTFLRSDGVSGGAPAGHVSSSLESANAAYDSGRDHMITYEITGLNRPGPTYLIAFEDIPAVDPQYVGSDYDYNDLVVEVQVVPEPFTMLGVLGAVGWVGHYLRKKRQEA